VRIVPGLAASNPAAPAATNPVGGDPRREGSEPLYTKSTPWPGMRSNPSLGWLKGGPATLQVAVIKGVPNPYTEAPQPPAKMPAAGIPTPEVLATRAGSRKPSMIWPPPVHCPAPPFNAGSNPIVPGHPPTGLRMPVRLAWVNGAIGLKAVELNRGFGLMPPLSEIAPLVIAVAMLVTRTWSTWPEAQKYWYTVPLKEILRSC
jgi:hypothetical protein